MFENPLIFVCVLALCWPGPLPIVVIVYLLNRYTLRLDIEPKSGRSESVGHSPVNDEV